VTDDLAGLYRDVIVEHGNRPRNHRTIEHGAVSATGDNPLCGDEITVYLRVDGDVIADVAFESHSCAIATASASLMTEALVGKTRAQALDLFDDVREMLVSATTGAAHRDTQLGKLEVLAGIGAYPMRVKCATLAWHTLRQALTTEPPSKEGAA
jgi:nitrogen fixation protein NifU and related proteins